MSKIVVLLTYDLATPPGLQPRFREEMKKLKWKFALEGKDLPETTCFARFEEDVTKSEAVTQTKADLREVSDILVKEAKDFKVKRSLILAMDEGHFIAALKDIG